MVLMSFVEVQPESYFPIQNLPYGVFWSGAGSEPRPCVAIGAMCWTCPSLPRPAFLTDRISRVLIASISLISIGSWKGEGLLGRRLEHRCKSCYQPQNQYCKIMQVLECKLFFLWFHIPIAYHGRASSIVISGTDIIRPRAQGHPAANSPPYFGPSHKMDFELEMAQLSPGIVTLDALEPFDFVAPDQDPPPLPYLAEKEYKNYDISLVAAHLLNA